MRRLAKNAHVCPECGFHFRISPDSYLDLLLDPGTFQEQDADLWSTGPPGVRGSETLSRLGWRRRRRSLGRREGVVVGEGPLDGIPVCLAVMDFRFLGGSMGSVVGEKIARIARRALELEPTPDHRQRFGGSPDAGGDLLPHAAGQDLRRPGPAPRGGPPLHLHPHRPNHRWNHGLLRHAG